MCGPKPMRSGCHLWHSTPPICYARKLQQPSVAVNSGGQLGGGTGCCAWCGEREPNARISEHAGACGGHEGSRPTLAVNSSGHLYIAAEHPDELDLHRLRLGRRS